MCVFLISVKKCTLDEKQRYLDACVYRARGKVTRKVCVCVYEEDGEINQDFITKMAGLFVPKCIRDENVTKNAGKSASLIEAVV